MAEYIEREKAEAVLKSVGAPVYAINALALVKSERVKADLRGRWATEPDDIEWGNFIKRKFCTYCGKRPHFDKDKFEFVLSDFCPNCGADMRNAGGDGDA